MRHQVAQGAILIALLVALALVPRDAEAYLDAGTGSYVIQLLIAGFVGMLFALKLFWRRIRGLFTQATSSRMDDDQPGAE
jgi:hypothetical protein